ncbi:hypothetical protein GT043_17180, partial [Streptomyces sp. SID2131]|nr:hypothetical protein [Streptomyces sp. SID2131]
APVPAAAGDTSVPAGSGVTAGDTSVPAGSGVTAGSGEPGMTEEALARSVARVFAATLGHPGFDVHANFFDLGGDSVNVTVAAARLGDELGAPVTAPALFASGTPVKLARLLGAEGVVLLRDQETATAPETAPVAVGAAAGPART